jgi:DNA-binding transcriptional LysR family regulator
MTEPNFIELKAVSAVAMRKNFRAAAIELGMSASALSHAVASLEAKLGVRLFNRTTRSVSLTQGGADFLARVEPAVREITQAMVEAGEQSAKPVGRIRINTSEVAGEQILEPIILEYLRRFPGMEVEIVTDGRLVDIVAGGFDAGVRLTEMVPRDMISIPVGTEQRHLVVGAPSYLSSRPKPRVPLDLKDHVCIKLRLPGGSIYRWEFEKRGVAMRIDVEGPLTLDNPHLILRAAANGAGLAYLSEWSALEEIALGRLVKVLEDWTPPYPGLCFYYPSRRHKTAGMLAFTELLRETVGRKKA